MTTIPRSMKKKNTVRNGIQHPLSEDGQIAEREEKDEREGMWRYNDAQRNAQVAWACTCLLNPDRITLEASSFLRKEERAN